MGRANRVVIPTLLLLPICGLLAAKELTLASSKEQNLETAGAPYAPLEVNKQTVLDSGLPLSKSQRQELLGEFKGLVHMGLKNAVYEKWEGKEMADCAKSADARDRWSYRCEILTGEGSGFYYFYPGETRQASTLQRLDIRVDASDEKLLDDFRRPVQELLGAASFVAKPSVSAKASGPIRHWNTGSDIAELFIDKSVRPQGSVRFVWMRSPLVGGAQVSLPRAGAETHPYDQ